MRRILAGTALVAAVVGQIFSANAQSIGGGDSATILSPTLGSIAMIPANNTPPIDLSTGIVGPDSAWSFRLDRSNRGSVMGGAGPSTNARTAYLTSGISGGDFVSWIGLSNGGDAYWLNGTQLTFSDTFYLGGLDLSALRISGGWAVGGDWYDGNTATLSLNGVVLGVFDDFHSLSTSLMPFSAPASLLNQDANTLSVSFRFTSTVDAPNVDQFFPDDVAIVSAMVIGTPEPSTWTLMLMGLAVVGILNARRKFA